MREFKTALEDEGFFVEKDNLNVNGEFKSGYYIKGINYLDNLDNLDNNSTQPPTRKELSENPVQIVQNVQEEFIEDSAEIIHQKCHICGCEPSTGYDKKGRPVCKSCALNLD